MKKAMILFMAMLSSIGVAIADEVTVSNVTVPQGGVAVVSISLSNPDKTYTAGQMVLTLPVGVTAVLKENGDPTTTKGVRMASTGHSIGASHLENGTEQFTIFSISSEAIPETEGVLFTATITADATLAVGTELEGRLSEIEMTTTDATPTPFNNQTFTITIGEPADTRVVLDELSATLPEAASGVDVRVRRTIAAGEWSTLCLPFSMTGKQVKAAFGADVELADFAGYEVHENADEEIVFIDVKFTDVNIDGGIAANHPCLIRVSADVSEFTVDGVDIDPDDEPVVATVKRTRKQWSEMRGTYVAGTEVPEKTLFLSGSQFWYSVGATRMKAFRAYFDFYDVLTEVDEAYAKVRFSVGGTPTAIAGLSAGRGMGDGALYTLSGQRVGKADGMKPLRRGLYIVNGKKVLNP